MTTTPAATQTATIVDARTATGCYCPSDCNCKSSYRPSYCGCTGKH